MMKPSTTYQLFVVAAVCIELGTSSSFLAQHGAGTIWDKVPTDEMKQKILSQIDEVLGGEGSHRVNAARVTLLENQLKPMVDALPKNENGKLEHVVVRYALHRLFVMRHGWTVKGLEPGAQAAGTDASSSSPLDALRGNVPEFVQTLFEKRLGEQGAEVHDVALMAALLENMAHEEAVGRLRASYELLGLDPDHDEMGTIFVNKLIDVYLMAFILGEELSEIPKDKIYDIMTERGDNYGGWDDTRRFAREVRMEVLGEREDLGFADVLSVISEIGERYGKWQDIECKELKSQLVSLADDGTGRVPLSKFYKAAYESDEYQFSESSSYLKHLGALDESDPVNPKVMVSNYVLSPTNCMASSAYYTVCCINECEDLLGHLETELQAPEAKAEDISKLVGVLYTATNRTLPEALLRRLEQVEESNGGAVPLHGRLFAQWMHHAYPNECPFPHLAGTVNPKTEAEYCNEIGGDTTDTRASEEEMRQFIDKANLTHIGNWTVDAEFAPWLHKEELLQGAPKFKSSKTGSVAGPAFFGMGLAALAMSAVRSSRTQSQFKEHIESKYFV